MYHESLQQVRAEYEAMTVEQLIAVVQQMGPIVMDRVQEFTKEYLVDFLMGIEESAAFG